MNKYHQEILEEIKKVSASNHKPHKWFDVGKYMGTSKPMFNISNPQVRTIIKDWIKAHKDISVETLVEVLNSLFQGESHTERSLGGKILEYLPRQRRQLDPELIEKWLIGAEGWGEVDSLCQSSFGVSEVLEKWDKWEKLFNKLVGDKDVHKRRAALVLLVRPIRESSDTRLEKRAFTNLDQLKGEKDILITKAVSWLLRSLIMYHHAAVAGYLEDNKKILPKIALRETQRKLLTGKK